jgi:hypothetical protein
MGMSLSRKWRDPPAERAQKSKKKSHFASMLNLFFTEDNVRLPTSASERGV